MAQQGPKKKIYIYIYMTQHECSKLTTINVTLQFINII